MEKININDLPVVRWEVDDDLSKPCLFANSFVSDPAMGGEPIYLSNVIDTSEIIKLKTDDVQQTVTCLLLQPNKPILRKNKKNEWYLAFLTEKDITNVKRKMFAHPETLSITTVEHFKDTKMTGVDAPRIDDIWQIADSKLDKTVALGVGPYAPGSLIATYYIPNKELYEFLRDNKLAYSGEFDFSNARLATEEEIKNLEINKIKLNNKMNLSKTISSFFKKKDNVAPAATPDTTAQLASYETTDGKVIEINEDTMEATIDGQPAADGMYTITVDGQEYELEIKDGKVTSPDATATASQSNDNAAALATTATDNLSDDTVDFKAELEKLTVSISEKDSKLVQLSNTNLALTTEIQELKKQIEELKKPNPIDLSPVTVADLSKMTLAQKMAYNIKQMARN